MEDKLKELEKRIGYKFQDFALIQMKSICQNISVMKGWNFWEMPFWSWYPVSFYFWKIQRNRNEN